jgi:hypothetical protein
MEGWWRNAVGIVHKASSDVFQHFLKVRDHAIFFICGHYRIALPLYVVLPPRIALLKCCFATQNGLCRLWCILVLLVVGSNQYGSYYFFPKIFLRFSYIFEAK